MKNRISTSKTNRNTTTNNSRSSHAGKNGISIAPPESMIDFVDQELVDAEPLRAAPPSPIQLTADPPPGERDRSAEARQENNTGLPDNLKAGVESLSGLPMDDVNVHYNSSKPARWGALAFTQGADIHVGPGQEEHLPHEAWHVAQQKLNRVRASASLNGEKINTDPALEKEADQFASHYTKSHFAAPDQSAQKQPTRTGDVKQFTVRDIVEADNYFGHFMVSVRDVQTKVAQDLGGLRNLYGNVPGRRVAGLAAFDVQHPDEFIEHSSIGLHHDMKELATKAGGFLYQTRLRVGLEQELGLATRGGRSNVAEPDIIGVPVQEARGRAQGQVAPFSRMYAIEAKKTSTRNYSTPLNNAIDQLATRRGFSHGIASIQLTDFGYSEEVARNAQVRARIATRAENRIRDRQQDFGAIDRSYTEIGVEIRDYFMRQIVYCRFSISGTGEPTRIA